MQKVAIARDFPSHYRTYIFKQYSADDILKVRIALIFFS